MRDGLRLSDSGGFVPFRNAPIAHRMRPLPGSGAAWLYSAPAITGGTCRVRHVLRQPAGTVRPALLPTDIRWGYQYAVSRPRSKRIRIDCAHPPGQLSSYTSLATGQCSGPRSHLRGRQLYPIEISENCSAQGGFINCCSPDVWDAGQISRVGSKGRYSTRAARPNMSLMVTIISTPQLSVSRSGLPSRNTTCCGRPSSTDTLSAYR